MTFRWGQVWNSMIDHCNSPGHFETNLSFLSAWAISSMSHKVGFWENWCFQSIYETCLQTQSKCPDTRRRILYFQGTYWSQSLFTYKAKNFFTVVPWNKSQPESQCDENFNLLQMIMIYNKSNISVLGLAYIFQEDCHCAQAKTSWQ